MKQLICSTCRTLKEETAFFVKKKAKRGRSYSCKECFKIYQKKNKDRIKKKKDSWYLKNRDQILKTRLKRKDAIRQTKLKYFRTKEGFLKTKYAAMIYRVSGRLKDRHHHLYAGLDIMPKENFIENSLKDKDFNKLFNIWAKSGYPRNLQPSPDRIDSRQGYLWFNIEWVTFSENCRNIRRRN